MKNRFSLFVVGLLSLTVLMSQASGGEGAFAAFNVKSFGATGDGETKDTQTVQKAIDACSDAGGGTVYLPHGTYLCGSLHLKSNVSLYLDAGATILGSKDDADYDPYEDLGFENDSDRETSYFHFSLIWGEEVENIGILGPGTVDSNREKRGGPKPIALKRCKYVDIKDITIRRAPNYAISMIGTDYVNIDGVSILDCYCDGIDPDCCRHVRISNCQIESWDDAIVPKASFSLGEVRSTEYLTITNCQLATGCNCFKLGTESRGDFKWITLSNCVMYRVPKYRNPIGGIAIESVDQSHIDGIAISNVSMVDVDTPIFLRLGNRGRDQDVPTPGTLKNVTISNIVATSATLSSSVTGIPGHPVEGITLSDIRLGYKGSGTPETIGIEVPEAIDKYPEAKMFGPLPTYGLFCRHVDGLKLDNVQVLFDGEEARHALLCEDVKNLEVDSFSAMPPSGGASTLKFLNVQDAFLQGIIAPAGTSTFLEVLGKESKGISAAANDFSRCKEVVRLGEGVEKETIRLNP